MINELNEIYHDYNNLLLVEHYNEIEQYIFYEIEPNIEFFEAGFNFKPIMKWGDSILTWIKFNFKFITSWFLPFTMQWEKTMSPLIHENKKLMSDITEFIGRKESTLKPKVQLIEVSDKDIEKFYKKSAYNTMITTSDKTEYRSTFNQFFKKGPSYYNQINDVFNLQYRFVKATTYLLKESVGILSKLEAMTKNKSKDKQFERTLRKEIVNLKRNLSPNEFEGADAQNKFELNREDIQFAVRYSAEMNHKVDKIMHIFNDLTELYAKTYDLDGNFKIVIKKGDKISNDEVKIDLKALTAKVKSLNNSNEYFFQEIIKIFLSLVTDYKYIYTLNEALKEYSEIENKVLKNFYKRIIPEETKIQSID